LVGVEPTLAGGALINVSCFLLVRERLSCHVAAR
jgi:hypothetical protein